MAQLGSTRIYGDLIADGDLAVNGKITIEGGNIAWHAGNDGSDSGLDADMLDELHLNSTTVNNQKNRVMRTDESGYANFGWINTTSGASSASPVRIYCSQDAYIRYLTPANFISNLDLLKTTGGSVTGKYSPPTTKRSAGMYGYYDSAKIGHVWSMGSGYAIPDTGANFGNIYGIAYKHTNNATGGTMAGGHQLVICSSGTPGVALGMAGGIWTKGDITGAKVYGAVYNDYAEYRKCKVGLKGGTVVTEGLNGNITQTKKRLCKIPMIVSDTYGFVIGETEDTVPIAVSGRVLAYTDKNKKTFKIGDTVCSGINGTVSKMKWWEKIIFPDRILGLVSEIPNYEEWGTDKVQINNRIWIKI